jgi:predicted SnoaL-like aldol condensation-catalyzing enzyme
VVTKGIGLNHTPGKSVVLAMLAIALTAAAAAPGRAASPQEEANKTLVLNMWRGVIEQHDDAAVMRYIAPDYIQHNTKLATGREALREAVRQLALPGAPPHPVKVLVSAVADGDRVVLVWIREEPDPNHPGAPAKFNRFDMFRIKDGLVVEHWDDSAPAR